MFTDENAEFSEVKRQLPEVQSQGGDRGVLRVFPWLRTALNADWAEWRNHSPFYCLLDSNWIPTLPFLSCWRPEGFSPVLFVCKAHSIPISLVSTPTWSSGTCSPKTSVGHLCSHLERRSLWEYRWGGTQTLRAALELGEPLMAGILATLSRQLLLEATSHCLLCLSLWAGVRMGS